jgi:hypothetical protein
LNNQLKEKRQNRNGSNSHEYEIELFANALEPLAELFLKSGYGASHVMLAAKIATISVASRNARIGNRLNHSRIAAITGLTRKEIRSLSNAPAVGGIANAGQSQGQRIARVIEGWKSDPAYLTDAGAPASLTVRGQGAAFPLLVRQYAGDVTPVAVLKELQRLGVVSRTRENRVKLKKATLRSPGIGSKRIAGISERMRIIGAALVDELSTPEQKRSCIFESSRELAREEAALFITLFSERAAELIDGAERWYRGGTGGSKSGGAAKNEKLQRVAIRVIVTEE